ncbi:MAG: hypothetical protein WCL02_07130 [bacterium]
MEPDYLDLVNLIIEDQITLEGFIKLSNVDQVAAEEELSHLLPVATTFTTEPKPIYFFKSADFPNLGRLFHCSKLFTFAHGGSPYKDNEISEYDVRKDTPYIQAAVYDSERKVFVTGLRFLPLYKDISFEMSAIRTLYSPTDDFIRNFQPLSLEIGQTFILPDVGSVGGQYLFSVMAAMVVIHKDARYLFGKPTIEGRIPDVSKEIISAFAYDAFSPLDNKEFNPSGYDLLAITEGTIVPLLRSFEEIVSQYNAEVHRTHPEIVYEKTMSVQKKRKITTQLLLYYGGSLPPMFKFYSLLTEEKGMICVASSVINPTYTTRAWEFPILIDKTKIASIHKRFVDYYVEYFQDKEIYY